MSEPFIGEIRAFGFNFAPRSWALCNGQLLPIAQNTALFSLLGTIYGGDGRTTFALPDLRGRYGMHFGNGPGLSTRSIGARTGTETNTLSVTQMPQHNHPITINASEEEPNTDDPSSGILATSQIYHNGVADTTHPANIAAVGNAGSSQPINNMPPYLVINYCIALQGLFPSRS